MATTNVKTAGAFDIRNIIGLLMGIYGLILVAAYFFLDPGINPDTGLEKEPLNNLWTGIALIVVALVFFAWAKIAPIRVDDEAQAARDAEHERIEAERTESLRDASRQVTE